jgi:hypothetical protein
MSAEQLTVAPPFVPEQLQLQEPDPLLVTVEAVPGLQRFDVGADVSVAPLLLPQTPLTGCEGVSLTVRFIKSGDP